MRGLKSYYSVRSPSGPEFKCFRHALRHPPLVTNALRTAAIVGTVLTAINQGDLVIQGAVQGAMVAKIALTYAVPYLVSTSGALAASRVGGA